MEFNSAFKGLNQDCHGKISFKQKHSSYQQIGHKAIYRVEHDYDVMKGTEYFVSL
jgi:hypothetical protein